MTNIPVKSLKYLTEGLIDYAGMFPPASLDIQTAFNNYLEYLKGPYRWMLGRFVCSVNKLGELSQLIKSQGIVPSEKIKISILGNSGENSVRFINAVKEDVSNIRNFNNEYNTICDLGVFEVPLPADTSKEPDAFRIRGIINDVSDLFEGSFQETFKFFYEYKPLPSLPMIIKALWYHNKGNRNAGYKLRTGGEDESAFPGSEQVALAIKTCREYEVVLKLTAGLHHPFRHYDETFKTKMHGFLNVFSAGIIEHCHNTTEEALAEIIGDEESGDFKYSENSLRWKNFFILASEVERGRKELMTSIGSCSFDEPINDLKKMNLLQ
jgi:hypothetical protein